MTRPLPLPRLLWVALAIPALAYLAQASMLDPENLEDLLHPTGEMSARLLIVALATTPLVGLLPGNRAIAWLRRQRRAIGLAAFGYGVLHLAFYLIAMGTLGVILAELGATAIWTGWLALLLLLPLALTSTDAVMRVLGSTWKRVQSLAYPAAVLTLVHWLVVHDGYSAALLHFAPLVLLQALRFLRRRPPVARTI